MRLSLKQGVAALSLTAGVFLLVGGSAAAQTFTSNRIIDDYIFNNYTSMTAGQINTFLNTFPSSCISPNNGFSSPDVIGYSKSVGYTYGGNVSAGLVISHAAQAYGINPQVILTTLQKEQSLVSGGSGCSTLAYTGATGYGCPDSGTTHSYSGLNLYTRNGSTVTSVSGTCVNTADKAGFSQQVIHATWLLAFGEHRSEGNISWDAQLITTKDFSGNSWNSSWNNSDDPQTCYGGPMTQGTFQVCPSPNGSPVPYDGYTTIDGVSTHMDTGATASLYWYTPHFSGNQHFQSIFTGWFGPSITSGFNWQYMGQNAYTDQTESTPADLTSLLPGQRVYLTVQAQNIGTQTWTTGVVNLGTSQPEGRGSAFYDSTWQSANRAATLDQGSVAPGQTGSFSFWVTIPNQPGVHQEYFDPVADGYSWMNDLGLYWQFTIQPPTYTWQYLGQNAYTDQTKATQADLNNVVPGQRYYLTLTAKNTGNEPWLPGAGNLGTDTPVDRGSVFHDSTWQSSDRAATVTSAVLPGQTTTFGFWVQAPKGMDRGGTYREYFDPVVDGATWLPDFGVYWQFTVPTPTYTWQYLGQNAYTDQTKATAADLTNVTPGQRIYLTLQLKNTGDSLWYPGQINLATSNPQNRTSQFYDNTWQSSNRASTIAAATGPGGTTSYSFWVTAPAKAGTYKEYFSPVADGIGWFTDYGVYWQFTVN